MTRVNWPTVLDRARHHVSTETTAYGTPPTLRRAHYLIVSDPAAREAGYRNTDGHYKQLSSRTAKLRDEGAFPPLTDRARSIEQAAGWTNVGQLVAQCSRTYKIDRAELMPKQVVIIAEKDGVVPLIRSRFWWLDVTASKGYTSQTHAVSIASLADNRRETVALYVGDYDPSGLDISRDLAQRLPFPLIRIGLTADQVIEHKLPPMMAKSGDSRTARMIETEGEAVQVELDALPAPALFDLISGTIAELTAVEIRSDGMPDWPEVDKSEREGRHTLAALAKTLGGAR